MAGTLYFVLLSNLKDKQFTKFFVFYILHIFIYLGFVVIVYFIDSLEEPKYLQLQMKVCRADFHGAIIRNIVVNVSSRFSSMNGDNSAQKFSKSILGYHKTKKKWHGPPSHKCREGKTSVVLPLKKHIFFMCVFPNKLC